jgi:hypothetical protein
MKHKVALRRRLVPEDGAIEDAEFVEILERSKESDDRGFLKLGSETWVFEAAEGREVEFRAALVDSRAVLDFAATSGARFGCPTPVRHRT